MNLERHTSGPTPEQIRQAQVLKQVRLGARLVEAACTDDELEVAASFAADEAADAAVGVATLMSWLLDDRPDLHEELAVWLQWAEVYFEAEPVELKVTDLLPGDKVHVDGYLLTVASVSQSYFGEYKVEVEERYPDLRLDARTRLTLVRPSANG